MDVGIPASLQGVLWSKKISDIDTERDKDYIVHQVLSDGTWEHVKWLFTMYGKGEIKDVFLHHPAKNYTEKSFHFLGNIVLGITTEGLDAHNYVKTLPRIIG